MYSPVRGDRRAPGELLWVPGGSPHAVRNLGDTYSLALAWNYIDEDLTQEAVEIMKVGAPVSVGAAALLKRLREHEASRQDAGSVARRERST